MSEIYGIDSSTYHRLPPEDQQAIRDSHQATQADPPTAEATTVADAPTVEPPTFATAQTPAEAVEAIHDLPLPTWSDIPTGFPDEDRRSIYEARVETFNERRAAQAQAAIDRLEPQLSDYDALNGATRSLEYGDARSAFANDPHVQQLHRIVDEATTRPTEVPAYLRTGGGPSTDVTRLDITQVRTALGALGIDLPADATPAQVQAGYEVLALAPDGVLAWAINPGQQVHFETPVAGAATLPLPVRGGVDLTLVGQVDMSGVQTGIDFSQTQTFELEVQMQGTATAAVGRTPLNKYYEWGSRIAERFDAFPELRNMVDNSPLLRNVVKGLPIPVSGSYEQFAGTRVTYEAVVTPEQGARIADGDLAAAPNPLDPMSMPIGTGTLIRGQTLTGSHFEANYKLLHLNGTTTDLSGQGFGVRRIDANTFEIVAGDVETVENDMFFGLGYRGIGAIGLGADRSLEERSMSVAQLDLRTEEGQAAYQAFMSSGQMPDWSPPGVLRAGTTEVLAADHEARFGLEIGGFGWSTQINSSELEIVSTRWADGTTENTGSYRVGDNHYSQVTWNSDAAGQPVPGTTRYGMVLANYDPALASYLYDAYNADTSNLGAHQSRDYDGNQHVRLEFTESELIALRDDARGFMQSDEYRAERFEALQSQDMGGTSFTESLALAETPDEVFRVLSNDFYQYSMSEGLLGLTLDTGQNTPGTLTVRDAG
ncbi:hypothetical protein FZO89_11260 [Luteimonas viscosa]|uniref:Uncharacterized protein n=1 Tax=Luteimonas viscosa TaxID=1132694 RepID=A0A5D4XTA6_9GAMM|nr:hypothetical protein [Luteimonas viscosa]TYT26791.1 hypothetical protein FZO89_11260 [Luteimonas viscosa]